VSILSFVTCSSQTRLLKIFAIAFLIVPEFTYAQSSVTGRVTDLKGNAIPGATVSVLSADKTDIVVFGTTDSEGSFHLKLNNNGAYTLKVSCLGYESTEKSFNTQEKTFFSVVLKESNVELAEVEIKAYPKSYNAKKDTVVYDLDKVKDGTERNIGEVINKLPGLSVDEEGKVSYQGNKIDNILIDGQGFFGNLQQIATQNLSADLIEKAELLTNFRESPLDIGGGKTVLNLKTNDKYKGVVTGDVTLKPGLVNKYLGHTNLFRFARSGNTGLIGDINNVGESSMSLADFIDLRGGISSLTSSTAKGQAIRLDPTQFPRFLLSDQNIKSKTNRYLGGNITSKINKKLDLRLYSLYNTTLQKGEIRSFKEFPGAEPLRFSEFTNDTGKLHYSTTHLNLKYLISTVSMLSFTTTCSFGKDTYDKSVQFRKEESSKSFLTRINNKNFTFGQNLEYQHKLSKYSSWISTLSYNTVANNQNLEINSDSTISFWGVSSLSQTYNTIRKDLNFNTHLSLDTRYGKYLLGTGLQNSRSKLESHVLDVKNTSALNRTSYWFNANAEFGLNTRTSLLLRNRLTGTSNEYNHHFQKIFFYEPGLTLFFNITPGTRLGLSADRQNQLPAIENLIEYPLVTDYRSLLYNKNLNPFKRTVINSYTLNFSSFGLKKEQFIATQVSYNTNFNTIFRTNILEKETSVTQYIYAPRENALNLRVSYDKKFYLIPLYFKSFLTLNFATGVGFAGDTETAFAKTLTAGKLNAGTRFRKPVLQIHGELDAMQNRYTQEVNQINSHMGRYIYGLRFTGVKGKTIYSLKLSQYLQVTRIGNNRINMLSPEIKWAPGKGKTEYGIRGYNVMNLTQNKIYTAIYSNISSTESEISILDGYILAGVKFKL